MFEHPHHQRIAKVLGALNVDLLQDCDCYLGGSVPIVLALGEYREVGDINFLCASADGFRMLRNTITEHSLGALMVGAVTPLREVRGHIGRVRTALMIDGAPVRIDFLMENRIAIGGGIDPQFGVPTLCRDDLYAEKLLAMADRGWSDSRDVFDLTMMIEHWGEIPPESWAQAQGALGEHVVSAYQQARERYVPGMGTWRLPTMPPVHDAAERLQPDTVIDIRGLSSLQGAMWSGRITQAGAEELLHLYESHWPYMDPNRIDADELAMLARLVRDVGDGVFLV